MSELDAFFANFGAYVARPDSAALEAWQRAHPDWESNPERLRIYGRHAKVAVTGLLATQYPKTRALLTPERWLELANAFYATRPARNRFELNSLAEEFPSFLAEQVELAPASSHVASLEWACFWVYARAAELPDSVAMLTLNPTLLTLSAPFKLCGYLSGRHAEPVPGDEVALVFRNPRTLRARYLAATDRTLLALKLVHDAIPLERVAGAERPVSALQAVLEEARQEGLLLGPAG